MKYSIIIPALNEEKLLPGLLAQLNDNYFRSKFDVEIIVSDGGSSDNTVQISKEKSDIVKLHTLAHRQNIAEGRNEGAKMASGDIYIFINADIIFPDVTDFFNYLENKFSQSSYLAMACRVKVFPAEEIFSDRLFHWCYNKYFSLLNHIGIGMGRGECQVIRKEIFNRVNGYNRSLAAGEDFDLFRRVKKHGNILFSSDVCVYESPRRYRKLGYAGVSWLWLKNGFSVLLKNKSISREWEQVR